MTAFQLMGVALAALLSENFIFVNCLGIGTRVRAFERPLDGWRTGYSLTVVMTLTGLISWFANQLLIQLSLSYYQTLVFALIGPCVVALLRWFLKNCIPELSRRMDGNLASITSNCAAMGCALLTAQRGYSLGGTLLFGFFGGVGATLALMCFAGLRSEVSFTSCPKWVQGIPIRLITAGLMGMALMGFYGLHLGT